VGKTTFSIIVALLLLCGSATLLCAQEQEQQRLIESAVALQQILYADHGLPSTILDRASCVIVFPRVKKVAVTGGGGYGSGVLVCRKDIKMNGTWGAPVMYRLDIATVDSQVGFTETDFVLVVTSRKGVNQVLSGKIKLGSTVTVAAGPLGVEGDSYSIATDVLVYAHVRGPFAGISLARASMDFDTGANQAIYGKDADPREIIQSNHTAVPAAQSLVDLLDKASPMRNHA
jgi:lipid-binding SYLF domain-containing protein